MRAGVCICVALGFTYEAGGAQYVSTFFVRHDLMHDHPQSHTLFLTLYELVGKDGKQFVKRTA
ncbi:MAG: hypothetical protein KGJ62_00105 [Armatimonadetes bacterium]|nr:hypothetical protein [Armatimonadota bacterium]MDE2207371.1 hypothetical protein [Armatimonadota bacterium]